MMCPYCRTPTFRRVAAGEREIDRCAACGALWFDYGEVRELTEGRLPVDAEGETPPSHREIPDAEKPGAFLSRMRSEAASLSCPRCGQAMTAIDFQLTGVPVLQCPACEGILAPRASAAEIAGRFRFLKEHGAKYAALGETLARNEKRRMEMRYGPAGLGAPGSVPVPLPVVVPLADDAPALRSFPVVTVALIALAVLLYAIGQVRGVRLPLPGGLPGLPSGTGFAGVPVPALLFAPFLQAGLLPLAMGSLFLYVLGDNVEDRMGRIAFFFFFLICGVCAGIAHVLWGKAGGPQAPSSPGAVAGVLGAYLVFFPNVSVRLYGMGRIVTLPAYLFACTWIAAVFFSAQSDPLTALVDPARLSLAGHLGGFGAGVATAVLWRFREQTIR